MSVQRCASRAGVWLPLFDDLADPRVVGRLAALAEEHGWQGFFTWDHVSWQGGTRAVADPWVTLASVAIATDELRMGPLVTPLARRRPAVLARQTATLDRLSGGRLVLGVGLGSDRFGGEYSRLGEEQDPKVRASMTDEALQLLVRAWSGEAVEHHGQHYTIDHVRFLPGPIQSSLPVWVAGLPDRHGPRRRAARHQGFFPVDLQHPDQLAEAVAQIQDMRADPDAPYDVAVALGPGTDPAPYLEAGATWCLTELDPDSLDLRTVQAIIRDGPPWTAVTG